MSAFKRCVEALMRPLDWIVTGLTAALLVQILLLILGRQIGLSWVWLYDVARWTLAWIVFIAAVPLTQRGAHLAIDVAANAMPRWAASISHAFLVICTVGIASVIAYYGGLETLRMYQAGERSMSGALPAFIGYGVMPLAFTLLAVAALASTRPAPPDYHQ